MLYEKYHSFKSIDYLKDEDFLRWQLLHEANDEKAWKYLKETYSDLNINISKAELLYAKSIKINDYNLEQNEINSSLIVLKKKIKERKKSNKKIRYIYFGGAAAACIFAITILKPIIKTKNSFSSNDIIEFAQASNKIDLYDKETKLILPNQQTVEIKSQIANVEYGDKNIQANKKIIHSEEDENSYHQLITPYGKRSNITFSDGTKVEINAGTKLVYPSKFKGNIREIYVDGEIFIDVVKDPNKPFIVKTNQLQIEVLGTKFNVNSYTSEDAKTIALLSGAIKVTSTEQNKSYQLKPNQLYTIDKNHSKITNIDAETFILWTKGIYKFNSEPLRNILNRLERYYGIKIESTAKTSNIKCSGNLDFKDDSNKLIRELTQALSINYRQVDDKKYYIN